MAETPRFSPHNSANRKGQNLTLNWKIIPDLQGEGFAPWAAFFFRAESASESTNDCFNFLKEQKCLATRVLTFFFSFNVNSAFSA